MDINVIKQRLNSLQSSGQKKEKVDYSKYYWKPKQEALAAQRDSGTITQEEFELKFKELPIRPIHPDDCESDEITVANCIANGVDWIYSKLEIH